MDISILISWKFIRDHIAWSAGYCPSCQQEGLVRLENKVEVISIWFVPVSKRVVGTAASCDFCEQAVTDLTIEQNLPLAEWPMASDRKTLLGKLLPAYELAKVEAEARLHSLLAAAKEASSVNRIDATFGVTTGIILGLVICVPISFFLVSSGFFPPRTDQVKVTMTAALAGILAGIMIGGVAYVLIQRRRIPFRKISETCANYKLDLNQVQEMSEQYGRVVQRSVRAVRDTLGMSPRNY